MIGFVILLIVIFVVFWPNVEGFLPCIDCGKKEVKTTINTVNPFVWPFSGTACLNNIRQSNTPDHALLE